MASAYVLRGGDLAGPSTDIRAYCTSCGPRHPSTYFPRITAESAGRVGRPVDGSVAVFGRPVWWVIVGRPAVARPSSGEVGVGVEVVGEGVACSPVGR